MQLVRFAALLLIACSSAPAASDEERVTQVATPAQPAVESKQAPAQPLAPSAAPATPQAPAAPVKAPLYQTSQKLMGTIIGISIAGTTEAEARGAVAKAFDELERLEALLSEWRPDSEISRINAAAGREPVKVSAETIEVIEAANAISRWSAGAFDLSWAALRGLYLFQPGQERVPELSEIKARLPLIDYRKIRVDKAASTVMLAKEGMALGTGGIAKGYALDRAADILRAGGLPNFMIFGGGQIELSGTREGRPWRVGIQHPRRDDYFGFVEATSGSVATAGDYEHAFVKDGKRWHHIIDVKTGLPVPHTSSVTVIADSGLAADAIDTAIFILGAKKALKLLPTAPFKADAVIVDSDMRVHSSRGMVDRLVMRAELKDGKLEGSGEP